MIAGPMFSNFMSQIAPGYGTDAFPEPPSNLLYGTPEFQPTVPDNPSTGGNTGGNTGGDTGGNTGGSTGGTGNSSNGNGNGNSTKGNG
jgi:hypothetical protein